MKSNCLILLFLLTISLVGNGNIAFSSTLEEVNIQRQAQFELLFANLEDSTSTSIYEDDRNTEIADLVNFYNLTNFIYKMIYDVAKTEIPGPITYSRHMQSTLNKLIKNKFRNHELNYETNAELRDFASNYIQKPFGLAVYDRPMNSFMKKYVKIKQKISWLVKQDIQKVLDNYYDDILHNDPQGDVVCEFMHISFAHTEIRILEAINEDFSSIWSDWHVEVRNELEEIARVLEVKVFDPSKTRDNLRIDKRKQISRNQYLRRALKIMKNLQKEQA